MKILVIGGTQFMGRRIVERLLAGGHDVSVLHRSATHDLGPHVRNLKADRADLESVRRLIADQRVDLVFDLAYDFRNGTPAEQVVAAAMSAADGLQRYVFMSSVAAYGTGEDLPETAPLVADDHPNTYAVHKASAERALFSLNAETGLPVTTIRPPFVHGPRQPFYREQFFWDRILDGRPIILPDDGDTPMAWAFADDVAEACVRATSVPEAAGEAFNVGHVERLTHRTFVEALARAAGVEATLVPVPRAEIHAAGGQLMGGPLYFGEVLDLPPATGRVRKAPRVLGLDPTPLDDALEASFAGYRSRPRRPVDYSFEDRLLKRRA